MKAFKTLYISLLKMFFRDHITFIVTFILPVALGTFLSFMFISTESTQKLHLTLVDEDGEEITRYMIKELIASTPEESLTWDEKTASEEAIKTLEKGQTDGVMILPDGTSEAVTEGGSAVIKVYYRPYSNLSAIARQLVDVIVAEMNLGMANIKKVFMTEHVPIGEQQTSLGQFYLPNFMAISALWLSLFATAMPLVKQREQKILLRLGATPLSPVTFMLANTLWRLTIAIVQSVLFLLVGTLLLHVDLFEHIFLLLVTIILGNLTFVAMGYMLAALSRTTQSAEVLGQICNFVMMFLSGVFFPPEIVPAVLKKISYAIPLMYLADLYRQIMVGFQGVVPMRVDYAILIGCGLVFSAIAVKFWRWQ